MSAARVRKGRDGTERGERIPRGVWVTAAVVATGGFLGQLDASLVNLGLETIRRDLGSSLNQIQWVANVYLLGLAIAMPLSGWLCNRHGAGRVWWCSLGSFAAASLLCAFAPTAGLLIGARAAQGLAAGLLVPAGQTLIGQAVGPERLGRVMGVLGIVVSLAPAIGPTVGGVLLDHLSWPWLFWVNLPIGLVGLLLGLRYVPRGETGPRRVFDWPGLALVSVGLPLTLYSATELGAARQSEFGPATLGTGLLVGVTVIAAFARRCLRRSDPLVNLRLFSNPRFRYASSAVFLNGASMFATLLVFPLLLQAGWGRSAGETGLLLLFFGLGTAAVMPIAGWLTDTYGGGPIALLGSVIVLGSTLPFLALGADSSEQFIGGLLLARGIGMGLASMPAMTATYAAVGRTALGDATTVANILMRVGGAVGGLVAATSLAETNSDTPEAFASALWVMVGIAAAACLPALGLWRAQERARHQD